jgi:hypothetical protein
MKYYKVVFTGIMIKGEHKGSQRYVNACAPLEDGIDIEVAVAQLKSETPFNEIFQPGYTYSTTEMTREEAIRAFPEMENSIP